MQGSQFKMILSRIYISLSSNTKAMYLAGLVILRCILKWFQRSVHQSLSSVRTFRDERMDMVAVDNTFYSDVLSRCLDMQKEIISKNMFHRFFIKTSPKKIDSCGETSNPFLFYVDIAIGIIITLQIISIFCQCRRTQKTPPAFPSPPTPPDSPPPSDKSLRKRIIVESKKVNEDV